MTIKDIYENDLSVIDLALPGDANPEFLREARDQCLSLIERLEFVEHGRETGDSTDHDGEELDDLSGWHALSDDTAGKLTRARLRLVEIDRALQPFGEDSSEKG